MLRRILAGIACMALLIAGMPAFAANPPPPQEASAIGGPFTLVDQDRHTVTDGTYRGKWLLLYFGYTHCPDTCPIALSNIAETLDRVDAAIRSKLQPIFVTVDPDRDTPAVMKDYVGAFEGARIVGLSGSREQVAAIESAYRIHAPRRAGADGEYSVDHSGFFYLVDPAGHFVALISDLMPPERLATRLTQMAAR